MRVLICSIVFSSNSFISLSLLVLSYIHLFYERKYCLSCRICFFFSVLYSIRMTSKLQASLNAFTPPIKSFPFEGECDFMFKKSFCLGVSSHLVPALIYFSHSITNVFISIFFIPFFHL